MAPSMSSNVRPRSRSSAAMRIASSSEVVVREVAKRKWSASSSPRNMPKWVWVLPTSMVRSTRGLSETSVAAYALALQPRQGVGERVAARRIQLEQRLQHEAALFDLGMRHPVIGLVDAGPLQDENVDVDRPRCMARGVGIASQLDLYLLCGGQQLIGIELRLDLDAGVEEVVLTDGARLRLGFVDRRHRARAYATGPKGGDAGAQVRHPVADRRPEAEPGPQSPRSFQTSTVTSSTGSGIGGSGFVARTVTASAL